MEDLMTSDSCSLPSAARPGRFAEFDNLFRDFVTFVERGQGITRLGMSGPPGVLDQVRELTARETSCSSFFTFDIAGDDRSLILEAGVPPGKGEILDALSARTEEFSP